MMLPDDIHENACAKMLAIIPAHWIDLKEAFAAFPLKSPSIIEEVLSDLRDKEQIEIAKFKQTTKVRRL